MQTEEVEGQPTEGEPESTDGEAQGTEGAEGTEGSEDTEEVPAEEIDTTGMSYEEKKEVEL